MKKLVYLTLLPLFINQIAYAQKIRTLYYDEVLYGKVKQVSQIYYLPGTYQIELNDTTWYDESGNTLEDHRWTMHGAFFKEKYINTNDTSGRKMEIIFNKKDQDLRVKFDSKGNLIEVDNYFKNGAMNFKSFYEYDEKNNLLSYRNINKNSSYNLKRTYKYDKEDTLIEEDTWDGNNKLKFHTDFQYKSNDKASN